MDIFFAFLMLTGWSINVNINVFMYYLVPMYSGNYSINMFEAFPQCALYYVALSVYSVH